MLFILSWSSSPHKHHTPLQNNHTVICGPNWRLTFNFPQQSHPPFAELPKNFSQLQNSSLNTETGNTQARSRPKSKQQLFEEAAKSTILICDVSFPLLLMPFGDLPESFSDTVSWALLIKPQGLATKHWRKPESASQEDARLPDWHKLWSRAPEGAFSLCHKGSDSSASIITKSLRFISSIKISVV